jgi:hypothetical protein
MSCTEDSIAPRAFFVPVIALVENSGDEKQCTPSPTPDGDSNVVLVDYDEDDPENPMT